MQSSTGQYSTHAGDPAQPVQHSVITASSFGFFLRAVLMPLERGSCFCSSGTIPGAFAASRSAAIVYILDRAISEHPHVFRQGTALSRAVTGATTRRL